MAPSADVHVGEDLVAPGGVSYPAPWCHIDFGIGNIVPGPTADDVLPEFTPDPV